MENMEVWLDRARPWLEVLERGVKVTVELIKGRPKLVATVVLTGLSSVALFRYVTKDFDNLVNLLTSTVFTLLFVVRLSPW